MVEKKLFSPPDWAKSYSFDVPQRFHAMGYRKGVKEAHKVLMGLVCPKCRKIIERELENLEYIKVRK